MHLSRLALMAALGLGLSTAHLAEARVATARDWHGGTPSRRHRNTNYALAARCAFNKKQRRRKANRIARASRRANRGGR